MWLWGTMNYHSSQTNASFLCLKSVTAYAWCKCLPSKPASQPCWLWRCDDTPSSGFRAQLTPHQSEGRLSWLLPKQPFSGALLGKLLLSMPGFLSPSSRLCCAKAALLLLAPSQERGEEKLTVWVIWFVLDNSYTRMRWTAAKSASFSPLRRKGTQAPWY